MIKLIGYRITRNFFLLLGLGICASAIAAGDIEQGRQKSVTCAACHGQDGNSINPTWPSIAGQNEKYLLRSLHAFKNGERDDVIMSSQVQSLDDQTFEDLAAYFATQEPGRQTTDPKLATKGERIYRGGNLERGVSACIACHGPLGHGNPGAGYPSIAGQHAAYTKSQLLAYRSNARQTDPNQIMRNVAQLMTEDEIDAVASYMQGLQ